MRAGDYEFLEPNEKGNAFKCTDLKAILLLVIRKSFIMHLNYRKSQIMGAVSTVHLTSSKVTSTQAFCSQLQISHGESVSSQSYGLDSRKLDHLCL